MKVAVTIGGVPKYCSIGLKSIRHFLWPCDVFLHAWDIEGFDIARNSYACSRDTYRYLEDTAIYKATASATEKIIDKEPEFNAIISKKKTLHGEHQEDIKWGISAISMFYSWRESDRLRRTYQKTHQINYDMVIRMRYDSLLTIPPKIKRLKPDQVITRRYNNDIIELYCAGGQAATKLSEIYSYLPDIMLTEKSVNAHYLMNRYLNSCSLKFETGEYDAMIPNVYKVIL